MKKEILNWTIIVSSLLVFSVAIAFVNHFVYKLFDKDPVIVLHYIWTEDGIEKIGKELPHFTLQGMEKHDNSN